MIGFLAFVCVAGLGVAGSLAWRAKQALIDDAQSGTRGYF